MRHVVFALFQPGYVVFRMFCSENLQIRRCHPGCKIEVESWVCEDDGYRSRNSGVVFEDPYDDCRTDIPTTSDISKAWTIIELDSRRITSEHYAQSTALHPDTSTFSLLNRPICIKPFFNRPGVWVYYQHSRHHHHVDSTHIQALSHNQSPTRVSRFSWPNSSTAPHDSLVPSL